MVQDQIYDLSHIHPFTDGLEEYAQVGKVVASLNVSVPTCMRLCIRMRPYMHASLHACVPSERNPGFRLDHLWPVESLGCAQKAHIGAWGAVCHKW